MEQKRHNGILRVQIKLLDIDKSAIFIGEKNKYLNASIILYDEKNEYDQHGMISQDLGKERREAGEKLIIGNVTWAIKPTQLEDTEPTSQAKPSSQPAKVDDDDDDFPF
jgi:hypothetical protein